MIMVKIFTLFLSLPLMAFEITLANRDGGVQSFVAGDLLKSTLKISPYSEFEKREDFLSFLEKGELGQFSIIQKKSSLRIDKDLNALFVDIDVVLRDEIKEGELFFYEYNKKAIPIRLKGLEYRFVGFKPKLNILNVQLPEGPSLWKKLIFIFLFLVIVIIFFIFLVHSKKGREKRRREKERFEILEIFQDRESRVGLEQLYQKRKHWENYVRIDLRESFYSVLNRYQYRKEWSEGELEEIRVVACKMELEFDD